MSDEIPKYIPVISYAIMDMKRKGAKPPFAIACDRPTFKLLRRELKTLQMPLERDKKLRPYVMGCRVYLLDKGDRCPKCPEIIVYRECDMVQIMKVVVERRNQWGGSQHNH